LPIGAIITITTTITGTTARMLTIARIITGIGLVHGGMTHNIDILTVPMVHMRSIESGIAIMMINRMAETVGKRGLTP